MKKCTMLMMMAITATVMNAATESPAGSGIYYDWDADGLVYVNWTDPNVLSGDVVFPATIEIDGYQYNPQYFGQYATQGTWGNANITSVTIEIPTAVPGWMFEQCTGMTTLALGEGVTAIGDKAFNGCSSLSRVSFPSTLESIGEGAFWGAPILDVVIPASVTSLGGYVFGGNTAMTSITFNGVPETLGEDLFGADYTNFMVGVSFWNLKTLKAKLDVSHSGLQYKVWDAEIDETWDNTTNLAVCYTDNLVMRRTIPAGKWVPIVIPAWLNEEQLKSAFGNDVQLAEATSYNGSALKFTELVFDGESYMAANTPYLIKVNASGSSESMPRRAEATAYNIPYVWLSDDYSSLTKTVDGVSFIGNLNGYENTVPADVSYIDETGELQLSDGTAPLPAMSGYFSADIYSIVVGDAVVTAVEAVKVDNTAREDNRIFDMMGRELKHAPAQGIYIQNGKKHIAM